MGEFLLNSWTYFATNVLTQSAYLIGFIALLGYLLLRRPFYECLAGFLKATAGYFILSIGSGGLVSNLRPILVGLKERLNLQAMVTDPYFERNAVDAGLMKALGRTFGDVMILLLIASTMNILLVHFQKYIKLRAVFTTENVQIQQAAIAFWILLSCFPNLGRIEILIFVDLILGCYQAAASNLMVGITQELTEDAGFAVAHRQMSGIFIFVKLAEWLKKRNQKKHCSEKADKKLEDIELLGSLSIFNENMVATSTLMPFFFGIILLVLGQDYLIQVKFMQEGQSLFSYIMTTLLNFAVYLAILQSGVRASVDESTQSLQGISNIILPGAAPGIDVAVTLGLGLPNAATIGFLFGILGQPLMTGLLILLRFPTIVIAGFTPLFFDNAVIVVYTNNRGGVKAACLFPFLSGLIQVGGSALLATRIGLSQCGGYLGMSDWAIAWPLFIITMKALGYVGIAAAVIGLLITPQLQYWRNLEGYFMIVSDYEQHAKKFQEN